MKSHYIKISAFILIIITSLSFQTTKAQTSTEKGQLGLGVIIGEPTGLSLKYWNGSKNAFDLGVAWSLQGNDAISIHGDYLFHHWLNVKEGKLAIHYGVGARGIFADDSAIGLRIPVGLNYLLESAPLGFFIEIAPIIDIIPSTEADGSSGIGVRYYF